MEKRNKGIKLLNDVSAMAIVFFLLGVFYSGTRYPIQLTYAVAAISLATSLISVNFRLRVDSLRIVWLVIIAYIWIWTKNYAANVLLYNIPVTLLILLLITYSHKMDANKNVKILYFFCITTIIITIIEYLLGDKISWLFRTILAPSYATVEVQNILNRNSFRAFASGNNVMSFACFAVICYGLYLYPVISKRQNNWKRYIIILLPIFAALLQSQRSNLVFAPLAMGIVYLVSDSKGRHHRLIRLLFILLCIIGIFILMIPFLSKIPAFTRVMLTIELYLNGGDISNNRSYLYDAAINMWKASPLIGHGWFEFFYSNHGIIQAETFSHAHNMVLELLADCGIVGTVLIMSPIIYTYACNIFLLRRSNKTNSKLDSLLRFTLAYQTFFLLDAQLHVTFYHPNMIIMYYVVIMLFYSLREEYRANEQKDIE